jgi:hypothetical protein
MPLRRRSPTPRESGASRLARDGRTTRLLARGRRRIRRRWRRHVARRWRSRRHLAPSKSVANPHSDASADHGSEDRRDKAQGKATPRRPSLRSPYPVAPPAESNIYKQDHEQNENLGKSNVHHDAPSSRPRLSHHSISSRPHAEPLFTRPPEHRERIGALLMAQCPRRRPHSEATKRLCGECRRTFADQASAALPPMGRSMAQSNLDRP